MPVSASALNRPLPPLGALFSLVLYASDKCLTLNIKSSDWDLAALDSLDDPLCLDDLDDYEKQQEIPFLWEV